MVRGGCGCVDPEEFVGEFLGWDDVEAVLVEGLKGERVGCGERLAGLLVLSPGLF